MSDDDGDPGLSAAIGAVPFGYGQHTTGGCYAEACKCKVTTLADAGPGSLRDCVASDDPKWVVFEGEGRGTIRLQRVLTIGSNTTIDGRGTPPVTLTVTDEHIAQIRDTENVVITDMRFAVDLSQECANAVDPDQTRGCGGGIQIDGKTKNVWIHQSEFETCGGKCISVWTRDAVDPAPGDCAAIAHGGDLVTISHNGFTNSFYGVLVGADHALADCQIPPMRATVYRNVFDNVKRRSPRSSELSHVHVLNNVMKSWGDDNCDDSIHEAFAASSKTESQMLLENNVFQARASAGSCKMATHIEGGFIDTRGNLALNGAVVRSNLPDQVFDPRAPAKESYDYTAVPMTTGLQQEIENAAGPRL